MFDSFVSTTSSLPAKTGGGEKQFRPWNLRWFQGLTFFSHERFWIKISSNAC